MGKRIVSYDKDAQIAKTKKRHGDDVFVRAGKKGGKNTPTKFNSESAKAAVNKRWAKHREEQAKLRKEEK